MVDEGPGREEEDDETNPKHDAAGAGDGLDTGVDGAGRLVSSVVAGGVGGGDGGFTVGLELAVAGLLLFAVGRSFVGSSGVGRGGVLDTGDAAALGDGEERRVAGALVDAALGGSDVGRGGSSCVGRRGVGDSRSRVGLLGLRTVALVSPLGVSTLRVVGGSESKESKSKLHRS